MIFVSNSVTQTMGIGEALGRHLRCGDVVALSGTLGAGKTQLVRGIAKGLGIDTRQVTSPTYVLMQEYDGNLPLVHVDAYRLEGLSDVESIGWNAELLGSSVTIVEWAERIADEIPADCLTITLEHIDDETRQLNFTLNDRWRARLCDMLPTGQRPTPCPTCQNSVGIDVATYPFCNDKCKMADLNRWFNGEYRLSRPVTEDDDLGELIDGSN